MTKWKKYASLIFLIGILCLFFLYNVPFPICKTIDALEICLFDDTVVARQTIVLDGLYHFNIFSADVYKGTISVSGYPLTNEQYDTEEITITKHGSVLEYEYNSGDDRYLLGRIHATDFLRDIVICIYQHDRGNLHQGTYSMADANIIVANADSFDAALQTLSSVFGLHIENSYS